MASGSASRGDYASRAGLKLEHALATFELDVTGLVCADFGCHAGGFTDCLLRHGAARVTAIDTGYGILDWSLRNDPRVEVRERTNALHAKPPSMPVDLVTIDLGWTPQRLAVPAALAWLAPGGRIVSLIKPHYELDEAGKAEHLVDGTLDPAVAERVVEAILAALPELGVEVDGVTMSPLAGAKSSRRGGGNREWLALLRKTDPSARIAAPPNRP